MGEPADFEGLKVESTGGIFHHRIDQCDGFPCPFHGPSLHAMIEEPMILRTDWGVPFIERRCRHGVGHPDPDSIAWLDRNGHPGFGMHGCDGCCRLPNPLDFDPSDK